MILVVDDNEDNRFTLTMRLEASGYVNIVTAENGRDALDKMRAQAVDLILLDIMMPELDGYGVLRAMQEDVVLRRIPVLVISAVDEIASVVKCIELGATDYLAKPFNPILLKARVDKCIEQSRLRAQEAINQTSLEHEKRRADGILATVLPREIVRALKRSDRLQPRLYDAVTVLFCDIVGFTAYSEKHKPETVFGELERLVEQFEEIVQAHRLEKIKTVGDAFMATSGLLLAQDEPVRSAVACGLDMVKAGQAFGMGAGVRVGIDHGPVVAGIMGKSQFQFDVWGDTVNTASRIEGAARPGSVCLSGRAWMHVRSQAEARSLGLVDLKGKQKIEILECTALKTVSEGQT
jgi:class 3 adenylate cyclase/CheY-like chemotaxis protein